VVITDKLKSYGAAKREILPGVEHRQSRYLNNRCENSHRPADASTRASHARIQIGRSRPTLLVGIWSDLSAFSSAAALAVGLRVP
jgi:transposase-like protein